MKYLCVFAFIGLASIARSVGASPVDLAEAPECPPGAEFYAEHQDCNKYYLCSNEIVFVLECPSTLFWKQEIIQCTFPDQVPECVGGTRPPAPEPTTEEPEPTTEEPEPTTEEPEPTTEEPEPTTEEPVPTTEEPEPTTEEPEPTTEEPEPTTEEPEPTTEQPEPTTEQPEPTTEEPEPTTEQSEPTTEQPELTTEQPEPTTEQPEPTDAPEEICINPGFYFLPHEDDCSKYYVCLDFQEYPMECAEGLSFDPINLECVREEDSTCRDPTSPPTTPEPTTEPPTPICDPDNDEIHFVPFEGNCSLYYVCISGDAHIAECAEGLSFDPVLLQCVRAEDSTCPSV